MPARIMSRGVMLWAWSGAVITFLTLSVPAAAQSRGWGAILAAPPAMPLLIDASARPATPPDTVVGSMLLELVVGETGGVDQLRVRRGLSPGVDMATTAAVRRWKFQPAYRSRRPIASIVHLELTFRKPDDARGSRDLVIALKPPPHVVPPESVNVDVVAPGTAGVQDLKVLRAVNPYYPDAAAAAKAEGLVELDVIVMPDGTVGAAKVRKSLDRMGPLDREALVTAAYWLFQPATLNGKPVAASLRLELAFRMN